MRAASVFTPLRDLHLRAPSIMIHTQNWFAIWNIAMVWCDISPIFKAFFFQSAAAVSPWLGFSSWVTCCLYQVVFPSLFAWLPDCGGTVQCTLRCKGWCGEAFWTWSVIIIVILVSIIVIIVSVIRCWASFHWRPGHRQRRHSGQKYCNFFPMT